MANKPELWITDVSHFPPVVSQNTPVVSPEAPEVTSPTGTTHNLPDLVVAEVTEGADNRALFAPQRGAIMKLKINGESFEFESPEDAARFYRAFQGQSAPRPDEKPIVRRRLVNGHSPAMAILQKIRAHAGSEMNGSDLAKVIGAASGNGVGPKLKQLRKALETENPPVDLDDYVSKRINPSDGTTIWMIGGAS